jgi:hypothetical protein
MLFTQLTKQPIDYEIQSSQQGLQQTMLCIVVLPTPDIRTTATQITCYSQSMQPATRDKRLTVAFSTKSVTQTRK